MDDEQRRTPALLRGRRQPTTKAFGRSCSRATTAASALSSATDCCQGAPESIRSSSALLELVTLTIEPGVVMRFEPKTAFMVQHFSTELPSTAVVRAHGTAEKPIVFTSASPTPKAGDWRGLWFGGIPQAGNVLDHVRIEYAGYDCACSLVTCSSNVEEYEGAVLFSMQPPSAFITNSVFKEIAGHAITEGFKGSLVNFRPTNTFEGVTGCVQTMPSLPTDCPDPRPICDGM